MKNIKDETLMFRLFIGSVMVSTMFGFITFGALAFTIIENYRYIFAILSIICIILFLGGFVMMIYVYKKEGKDGAAKR